MIIDPHVSPTLWYICSWIWNPHNYTMFDTFGFEFLDIWFYIRPLKTWYIYSSEEVFFPCILRRITDIKCSDSTTWFEIWSIYFRTIAMIVEIWWEFVGLEVLHIGKYSRNTKKTQIDPVKLICKNLYLCISGIFMIIKTLNKEGYSTVTFTMIFARVSRVIWRCMRCSPAVLIWVLFGSFISCFSKCIPNFSCILLPIVCSSSHPKIFPFLPRSVKSIFSPSSVFWISNAFSSLIRAWSCARFLSDSIFARRSGVTSLAIHLGMSELRAWGVETSMICHLRPRCATSWRSSILIFDVAIREK